MSKGSLIGTRIFRPARILRLNDWFGSGRDLPEPAIPNAVHDKQAGAVDLLAEQRSDSPSIARQTVW